MRYFLGLILLGLLLGACDEKEHLIRKKPPRPWWFIGDVIIDIAQDTLSFYPGDSASTLVTIIVRDNGGNLMEGVKVDLVLGNPQLGFIEFVDLSLRDTTNALGRVNLIFTAISTAGSNILSATAGGTTTTKEIVIQRAQSHIGTLSITAFPDTIQLIPGEEVEVDICVTLVDVHGAPITDYSLPIWASGGRLAPLPPTDLEGRVCTTWFFNENDEPREYCITLSVDHVDCTACVTVLPPGQP